MNGNNDASLSAGPLWQIKWWIYEMHKLNKSCLVRFTVVASLARLVFFQTAWFSDCIFLLVLIIQPNIVKVWELEWLAAG